MVRQVDVCALPTGAFSGLVKRVMARVAVATEAIAQRRQARKGAADQVQESAWRTTNSVKHRTGAEWIIYKLGYHKRPLPFLREPYSKHSPNLKLNK